MEEKKYVFRNIEDAPTYPVDKCSGGVGLMMNTTLLGDEPKMPVPEGKRQLHDSESFHYVHKTTLPPGAAVGEHPHEGNEQFYLIVEGEGEVYLCGEVYPVKPWSIAMIRSGGSHGIKNTGDKPLVYICCEISLSAEAQKKEDERKKAEDGD